MNSIARRLTLASNAVLLLCLSLIGVFLERTYRDSVVTGAGERLRPVIYALMSSADEEQGLLSFAEGVSQPRLQQPGSDMYALVTDRANGILWRSPSLATADPDVNRQISDHALNPPPSDAGAFFFDAVTGPVDLYCLSNEAFWEGLVTPEVAFTVCVDQLPYQTSVDNFRYGLIASFGVLLVVLSLVGVLALGWGMRPLRQIQNQLQELEQGDRSQLEPVQPRELAGLVASLNRFVTFEAAQRKRYRQALDDLAHSLKTPLSVLGLGINHQPPDLPLLQDQVARMQGIVDHQLARVARLAETESPVDRPWVSLEPVVQRLMRALSVSYPDNDFQCHLPAEVALRVHEDDLLDIVGNVLENACKHGARCVRVRADVLPAKHDGSTTLVLCVDDDGPGIDPSKVDAVLSRGTRLDSQAPGQGIGLAMVVQLLSAYGASMAINASALGGTVVSLSFPNAKTRV